MCVMQSCLRLSSIRKTTFLASSSADRYLSHSYGTAILTAASSSLAEYRHPIGINRTALRRVMRSQRFSLPGQYDDVWAGAQSKHHWTGAEGKLLSGLQSGRRGEVEVKLSFQGPRRHRLQFNITITCANCAKRHHKMIRMCLLILPL